MCNGDDNGTVTVTGQNHNFYSMVYAHARAKNDMEYLHFIYTGKWSNTNYFELNFKLKTKVPKTNF